MALSRFLNTAKFGINPSVIAYSIGSPQNIKPIININLPPLKNGNPPLNMVVFGKDAFPGNLSPLDKADIITAAAAAAISSLEKNTAASNEQTTKQPEKLRSTRNSPSEGPLQNSTIRKNLFKRNGK